jgi:hypothetical protein
MKILFVTGILTGCITGFAQTKIEKSIPVQAAQKLELNFDYPKIIKVQSWDKKEVLIKGNVTINMGENDNAFELLVNNDSKVVSVTSSIKDKENIPHRIMIKKGEREYFFKAKNYNDPEVQKFLEENGREYSYMSNGIIKDIVLDVFVPKGMETTINAKHGLVEVKSFDGPLAVIAQHGGIDATITKSSIGEIIARTRYGEILTNLDVKFASQFPDKHDKWTEIQAKLGAGPKYTLESKHGKVYLRKP